MASVFVKELPRGLHVMAPPLLIRWHAAVADVITETHPHVVEFERWSDPAPGDKPVQQKHVRLTWNDITLPELATVHTLRFEGTVPAAGPLRIDRLEGMFDDFALLLQLEALFGQPTVRRGTHPEKGADADFEDMVWGPLPGHTWTLSSSRPGVLEMVVRK